MTPDLACQSRRSRSRERLLKLCGSRESFRKSTSISDLLEALRRYAGYREGDWDNPSADGYQDTFYVFPYDWRQDNVANARELVRRIERLKRNLGVRI